MRLLVGMRRAAVRGMDLAVANHAQTHAINNGERWYALWTKSRHERLVAERLAEKRYVAFLPTVTRWSRWKDRRKRIDWPMFPGYLFARFDASSPFPILNCAGVASIVSFNARPAPIPDEEIESIRTLVQSELRFDPCPFIHEGMTVEVVRGPLRGVIGRLVRKDNHRMRVFLSVDLIGQGVSVEIDASDVEPLAS